MHMYILSQFIHMTNSEVPLSFVTYQKLPKIVFKDHSLKHVGQIKCSSVWAAVTVSDMGNMSKPSIAK